MTKKHDDTEMRSFAAMFLGMAGGATKNPARAEASRINGRKGGRPKSRRRTPAASALVEVCPKCGRVYPYGDTRSLVPGRQCFECDEKTEPTK
jgi:hypothetical protein